MELWVARDTTNILTGFEEIPKRGKGGFFSPKPYTKYYELDEDLFPEIIWENSPRKAKIGLI